MINLNTKQKAGIAAAAVVVAFGVGRWSAPVQVKTETKIVEVEKKTEDKKIQDDKDSHIKTTKTEVDKPDGTKTIVTVSENVTTDKKIVDDQKTDDISKVTDKTKIVTKESSKIHLDFLAGANVTNMPGGFIYGASVSKDLIGPISVGVFGFSDGIVGGSIGISF